MVLRLDFSFTGVKKLKSLILRLLTMRNNDSLFIMKSGSDMAHNSFSTIEAMSKDSSLSNGDKDFYIPFGFFTILFFVLLLRSDVEIERSNFCLIQIIILSIEYSSLIDFIGKDKISI